MQACLCSLLALMALVISAVPTFAADSGRQPDRIRFGALPVLQALPLYLAQERGLLTKAGLDVEIIPFNGPAEKDIALTTGSIDGYFGDLVTPAVLKGNGRDVVVVATNYDTRTDRRMFAVLAKPGSAYTSVANLSGVPVALSSNSVIDYVTETLLAAGGVPADKIERLETKDIGLRMQMLLSGQVQAATLPEPLVTAAASRGAKILADDSGLGGSQTVLVFSGAFLRKHGEAVRTFLRVVNDAQRLVNAEPDAARSVMVAHVRLPEALKSSYPVPRFPDLRAPDRDSVHTIVTWLKKRGVFTADLTYESVVNGEFLP